MRSRLDRARMTLRPDHGKLKKLETCNLEHLDINYPATCDWV